MPNIAVLHGFVPNIVYRLFMQMKDHVWANHMISAGKLQPGEHSLYSFPHFLCVSQGNEEVRLAERHKEPNKGARHRENPGKLDHRK